jgi:hypothetical protein
MSMGECEDDINTVNPLGLEGQLAMALGNLMNSKWRVRRGVGTDRQAGGGACSCRLNAGSKPAKTARFVVILPRTVVSV